MKKYISLILALVMSLSLLSGCATQGTVDPEDMVKRTDITVGEEWDAVSLDPHVINDEISIRAAAHIYESLVKQDENLEIVPSLAETWENKSDTEIIFHLKKGIKFHNGEEMKASDVKFSLERAMAQPIVMGSFHAIDSVEAVDDYTVSVKLNQPYAEIMDVLSGVSASIVSEKAVSEYGDEFGVNPVGTGAMKLKEWMQNDYIVLEAFEEYHGGKPLTTTISIKIIPEGTMRNVQLKAGHIDFSYMVQPTDVDAVLANKKLKTESELMTDVVYVSINTEKEPFDNLKVRQALSHAADKESIKTVVLEENGAVAHTMLPSDNKDAVNDFVPYPYDIEKAKALLAEAGYPDGFKANMYVHGDSHNKAATVLQSDFSAIGVELEVNLIEKATILDQANNGKADMVILSHGVPGNTDATLYNLFHSSVTPGAGNKSRYKNAEVDKLLEAARAEYDDDARSEIYKEAQRIIMADAPVIPLYTQEKYYGMTKFFEGYKIYKNGRHDLSNAYVLEEPK